MMKLLFSWITLVSTIGVVRAAEDPLRFFPADAPQLILKIERPLDLINSVVNHQLVKEAEKIPLVQDFLDGADARRAFQLLRYYENDLHESWPKLVEKTTSGGVVLGLRLPKEGEPVPLLVIQGSDEATTKALIDSVARIVKDELAQETPPQALKEFKIGKAQGYRLGNDFHLVRSGAAILIAGNMPVLEEALQQSTKPISFATSKGMQQVKTALPGKPLVWLWSTLKPVHESPMGKDLFTNPRNDPVLTVLFAGLIDIVGRSDHIAVGLYHEDGDFRIAVRMPAGKKGSAGDVAIHVPVDGKLPGTLPPLEPEGVLFSHSFYLDLNTLYTDREKIFPKAIAESFAEGEKQISRFLVGSSLPKFLSQSGVNHRIVIAQPETVERYKVKPTQKLPSFAFVTSMRDPGFARTTKSIIRAGVLAVSEDIPLRSWSGEIEGVEVYGYYFPEKGKFPDDEENLRFNYEPVVGVVNDQLILCSNHGLMASLIKEIKKSAPPSKEANLQTKVFAKGLGDFALVDLDSTLAGMILAQGVKLQDAKQQTKDLLSLLQKLGTGSVTTKYFDNKFELDIQLNTKATR